MRFCVKLVIISIISLKLFSYNNVILLMLLKKIKFYIIFKEMLKSVLGTLDKITKIEIVLESDKKCSSQLVKSLQIIVSNVKLPILVTLTSALRTLVNKSLIFIILLMYLNR